jgi:hypothetical protein
VWRTDPVPNSNVVSPSNKKKRKTAVTKSKIINYLSPVSIPFIERIMVKYEKTNINYIIQYFKYYVFDLAKILKFKKKAMAYNSEVFNKAEEHAKQIGYIQNHGIKNRKDQNRTHYSLNYKKLDYILDFVQNYLVNFLIDMELVPADVFPCGSTGQPHTIDIIKSAQGTKLQSLHTDYCPHVFNPIKPQFNAGYNGASIIFNHQLYDQQIYDKGMNAIKIPSMGFIFMTGDFEHLGDCHGKTEKNCLNKDIDCVSRYFLYFDSKSFKRSNNPKKNSKVHLVKKNNNNKK